MNDPILIKREESAACLKMAKDLVSEAERAKRDLTSEEARKVDDLLARAESSRATAERLEKVEQVEQRLGDQPGPIVTSSPRGAPVKGFKRNEDAWRAGMWLKGVVLGDESALRWVRSNMPRAHGAEGVGTKGGFVVPEELSDAIVLLTEEYGVARRECRILRTGSDTTTVPKMSSGLTPYYVSENAEVTTSDAAWDQITLSPRKLGILHRMSAELREDSVIDLVQWMAEDIARAFAAAEDDALFNGDGTDDYGGIYGLLPKIIDGNHAAGAVDAASGVDSFTEVTQADLSSLMGACPEYALPNAKWFCSQACYANVFLRLMGAAGGNSIETLQGDARSYLGFPIEISQKMPTSTGDLSNLGMLAFGDMRLAAAMALRTDIRIMTSTERWMEYDQVGILGIERYDIKVHSLGDGTTAGPVVVLVGE